MSPKASNNLAFGGAVVGWRRQQAPAPAVATFADAPTHFLFFRAIENLAAAEITGGCARGNFCPNANITRGEAAAFFSRELGLHFQQEEGTPCAPRDQARRRSRCAVKPSARRSGKTRKTAFETQAARASGGSGRASSNRGSSERTRATTPSFSSASRLQVA